jgi:hypothetical protein
MALALKRTFRKLIGDKKAVELAESAVTLPVAILLAVFMTNATLAGFTSMNAANAANYGSRRGSVHQTDPVGAAAGAAWQQLNIASIGDYSVSVSGGGQPGAMIAVSVHWEFPNFFKGLTAFFGISTSDFEGTAISTFRQEGW